MFAADYSCLILLGDVGPPALVVTALLLVVALTEDSLQRVSASVNLCKVERHINLNRIQNDQSMEDKSLWLLSINCAAEIAVDEAGVLEAERVGVVSLRRPRCCCKDPQCIITALQVVPQHCDCAAHSVKAPAAIILKDDVSLSFLIMVRSVHYCTIH